MSANLCLSRSKTAPSLTSKFSPSGLHFSSRSLARAPRFRPIACACFFPFHRILHHQAQSLFPPSAFSEVFVVDVATTRQRKNHSGSLRASAFSEVFVVDVATTRQRKNHSPAHRLITRIRTTPTLPNPSPPFPANPKLIRQKSIAYGKKNLSKNRKG